MLGPVQTPYFTWAESNANEREQRILLICIRFGSCEVRRLNLALVTSIVTCLTYSTSLLAVTIVNNFAVTCPCKNYAGWLFLCPYRNVGFPDYNLHRATNSPLSRNKIRLAFHFVERNKETNPAKSQPKLGLRSTSSNAISLQISC